MTTLHEAARRYVAEGFRVFPLHPNGKEPITAHGVKDGSSDPAQIDAWWTAYPGANIGISPGDTGCFVVDCDVKNDIRGIENWHEIAGDNTGCTRVAVSPSGGRHYWYKGVLRNSAGKIAPGIDTRGIGGYVVVPPSVVNDIAYKWLVYAEPQPMDDALYVTVQERVGGSGSLREIREAEHPELIGTEYALLQGQAYISSLISCKDFPQVGNRDEHATRVFIQLYCLGLDREQMVEQYARLLAHGGVGPDNDEDLLEKIDRLLEGRVACNAQGSELLPLASSVFETAPPLVAPPLPTDGTTRSASVGGRRGDQIPTRKIEWFADGILARGKFHVLAGKQGVGKSTIVLNLLAAITNGGLGCAFPTGEIVSPGEVAVWSGEDDWEDTIAPRLLSAGADMTKVWEIDYIEDLASGRRDFDPAMDIPRLEGWLDEHPGVVALQIDPLASMFSSSVDSHNNASARGALQPLRNLAKRRGIMVIGITHMIKKNDSTVTLADISGSGAVTQLPRVVLGVGGGMMTLLKSNMSKSGGGYPYELVEGSHYAQRIVWGKFVEGDAEELTRGGDNGSLTKSIDQWLMRIMHEAGEYGRPSTSIKRENDNTERFNWNTVIAARKRLGIAAVEKLEAATNGIGAASKKPVWHWVKRPS